MNVFFTIDMSAWFLQVEEHISVEPGLWLACDGSHDLHDGDGQPTPRTRGLHAHRTECTSGPLHP